MSDNKSYRIKANIQAEDHVDINLNLNQDIDVFEFLSMKIGTQNFYRLHTADYGCVAGRVLANNSVGVPNVKISIFIEADEDTKADSVLYYLYPYSSTNTVNDKKIKYNLLPEDKLYACHQNVGTFPSKRMVLDDNNVFEIFDKYYKFTTTTNSAGDYMIFGVPTGAQILHMDVDLSDIGDLLSQRPRDFIYKGYNATQFENSNMFKKDNNLNTLVQIMSQDETVDVHPFWGEAEEMGELDSTGVRITRKDINLNYKFEPTCVFMGSLISDEKSNGFTARCIPTERMGKMDRLTTGEGTIEMIRKTPDGEVEEYSVQGNQLIDGNGTWCYQIPMNLDYVRTDEYGNIVPTSDTEKGMPTRARVRFRFSLTDFQSDYQNNHLVKMLVPNNPNPNDGKNHYVFGTYTPESDFRDLFWNKVYSVKSYIPRLQKSNWNRDKRFSGIKAVNVNGGNNPIPYNNMRINITFLFTLQCAIMHILIWAAGFVNTFMASFLRILNWLGTKSIFAGFIDFADTAKNFSCLTIGDGACPDLEGWYFAPKCDYETTVETTNINLLAQTRDKLLKRENEDSDLKDKESINFENKPSESGSVCVTNKIDYFIQCIEIALAQEYEVIQFDFYNDWINGLLYIPRWFGRIRKKRSYLFGLIKRPAKTLACIEGNVNFQRKYTQQCALEYTIKKEYKCLRCGLISDTEFKVCPQCSGSEIAEKFVNLDISSANGCKANSSQQVCHKGNGRKFVRTSRGGYVNEQITSRGEYVYYFKPYGLKDSTDNKKINYFATDIILLGSLNEHDIDGIPQTFKGLVSSTYQMPTNLAATNMDVMGYMYGDSNGKSVCDSQEFVEQKCYEEDKRPAGVTKSDIAEIFKYMGKPFRSDTYSDYLYKDCGLSQEEVATEVSRSRERQKKKFRSTTSEEYKYCDKIRTKEVSLLCAAYSDGGDLTTPQAQQLPDTFSTYKTWGSKDDDINGGLLNDETEYEITEASGIDWGYTGPGQGKPIREDLYQPGGHFLGIACFNAESNIKSCVNLSRACEIGTSLSQRQAVPILKGSNNVSSSGATVPTGLISRDEITDTTFRTEFATLNHNGLLATKKNPLTNRLEYDFALLTPVDFDGSFNRLINAANVKDQYNNLSGNERESAGDENGQNKTIEVEYTRTIEKTSVDYLAFRLGLFNGVTEEGVDNKFLNVAGQPTPTQGSSSGGRTGSSAGRVGGNGRTRAGNSSTDNVTQTANEDDSKSKYYSLPMYNNSYYFYFGLHDGATALDRFYKEFYAECPRMNEGKIVVNITVMDANPCDSIYGNRGSATIRILGLDPNVNYQCEWSNSSGTATLDISGEASKEFSTGPLFIGNYAFTLKIKETGEEIYHEAFSINSLRPEWLNDISVSYSGFTKQKFDEDLTDTDGRGKVRIMWPTDSDANGKLTGIYISGNTDENLLNEKVEGLGVWIIDKFLVAGNKDYTVRITSSCGNYEIYSFYCPMPKDMDILIGGSKDVTYKKTIEKKYELDPESEWWAAILSGSTDDDELFFTEKAITFRGSLANWDVGNINVEPVGAYTTEVDGTSEKLGSVVGNRKKLSFASGSAEGYSGPFYNNFVFPTRNAPSGIGYTIITELSAKTDYSIHIFDYDGIRLPAETEEEQAAKNFRLPSIYKPFLFRALMFRDKTAGHGGDLDVKYDIAVANANLYKGKLDSVFLCEEDVIKDGVIGPQGGAYFSGESKWWAATGGSMEKFPIFKSSGVTRLDERTPGTFTGEYNIYIKENEPDMTNCVLPAKEFYDWVTFIGDKGSENDLKNSYSTKVMYFKLYRTDANGVRITGGTSSKEAYCEWLSEKIGGIQVCSSAITEDATGTTIYWSGSCTKAFSFVRHNLNIDEYFIFNPLNPQNVLDLSKVFSGQEMLDIDTSDDCFILGVYDPWTQLSKEDFNQITNKTLDVDKYDFVGKDTDMLTILTLYDAQTFEAYINNSSLPPILEWKSAFTTLPMRGTTNEGVSYLRKYMPREAVTATSDAEWLTVVGVDAANDRVIISAGENTTGSLRSANLTISSGGSETLCDTIPVYQNYSSGGEGEVYWSTDPVTVPYIGNHELYLRYGGTNLDKVVRTVYPGEGVDWITVIPTSLMVEKVCIDVSANSSASPRSTTLTIEVKDNSGNIVSDTCTVTQEGNNPEPFIEWDVTEMTYPAAGTGSYRGDQSFDYENIDQTGISVSADVEWLVPELVFGADNEVYFYVRENTGTAERVGHIRLFVTDQPEYFDDLTIIQSGSVPYLEVSDNIIEFTYTDDAGSLFVSGNTQYNMTIID